MAGFTTTVKNTILSNLIPSLVYLSLHTADPGATGANEASGGSPAYARKLVTWGTPASGTVSATQVNFDAPANTYSFYGYWSAATGGTFLGGSALTAAQTLTGQGVVQVTASESVTSS